MSTIKVDTLQTTAGLPRAVIAAHASINMTTTTIHGSMGVSSFTDVSGGNWDANFSNTMSSLGYVTSGSGSWNAASDAAGFYVAANRTRTTALCPIAHGAANAAWNNRSDCYAGGGLVWIDG